MKIEMVEHLAVSLPLVIIAVALTAVVVFRALAYWRDCRDPLPHSDIKSPIPECKPPRKAEIVYVQVDADGCKFVEFTQTIKLSVGKHLNEGDAVSIIQ